jgi:hypothetical protein
VASFVRKRRTHAAHFTELSHRPQPLGFKKNREFSLSYQGIEIPCFLFDQRKFVKPEAGLVASIGPEFGLWKIRYFHRMQFDR